MGVLGTILVFQPSFFIKFTDKLKMLNSKYFLEIKTYFFLIYIYFLRFCISFIIFKLNL